MTRKITKKTKSCEGRFVPSLPAELYQHGKYIYDMPESAGSVPVARFYGRPDLPNDRTLEFVAKVVELYNKRISDAPAQGSEARPGVEEAHEGTTADESELLPTQLPRE